MLLDCLFVEVVIQPNEVIQWEGGLEEVVPKGEEVELELEADVLALLLVDVALIVLAHVVPFDVGVFNSFLHLVHETFVSVACESF